MTATDKATLKTYFETGDTPTQSNFTDLIDSFQNLSSALTDLSGTAASARTHLGLGTIAILNQGTAQGTVPVFNTAKSIEGFADSIIGGILSPVNRDYVLDQYAPFPYDIEWIAAKTSAGSNSLKLVINSTDVVGTTAKASAEAIGSATSNNSVAIGDTVKMTVASASSVSDLSFTIKVVRT